MGVYPERCVFLALALAHRSEHGAWPAQGQLAEWVPGAETALALCGPDSGGAVVAVQGVRHWSAGTWAGHGYSALVEHSSDRAQENRYWPAEPWVPARLELRVLTSNWSGLEPHLRLLFGLTDREDGAPNN